MGDIGADPVAEEVVEAQDAPLELYLPLLNVPLHLNEGADVLGEGSSEEEVDNLGKGKLFRVLHPVFGCEVELPVDVTPEAHREVVVDQTQGHVAQFEFLHDPAVLRPRDLVAVLEEPFAEGVQAGRSRMADGALHLIFPRKGRHRLRGTWKQKDQKPGAGNKEERHDERPSSFHPFPPLGNGGRIPAERGSPWSAGFLDRGPLFRKCRALPLIVVGPGWPFFDKKKGPLQRALLGT